jgi:hypothetical protein
MTQINQNFLQFLKTYRITPIQSWPYFKAAMQKLNGLMSQRGQQRYIECFSTPFREEASVLLKNIAEFLMTDFTYEPLIQRSVCAPIVNILRGIGLDEPTVITLHEMELLMEGSNLSFQNLEQLFEHLLKTTDPSIEMEDFIFFVKRLPDVLPGTPEESSREEEIAAADAAVRELFHSPFKIELLPPP